jgi:DMSO/TMAO reductase YedYZ molybdopterin-dependent catalytic subunit
MSSLRIEGEVDAARELDLVELAALPGQVADVAALVVGREGRAVRLAEVIAAAAPRPTATHATLASGDGKFAISVPLPAIARGAVLVYGSGDGPLPRERGGPLRLLLVDLADCGAAGIDACANVKDLRTIRLTAGREPDVGHRHDR